MRLSGEPESKPEFKSEAIRLTQYTAKSG